MKMSWVRDWKDSRQEMSDRAEDSDSAEDGDGANDCVVRGRSDLKYFCADITASKYSICPHVMSL